MHYSIITRRSSPVCKSSSLLVAFAPLHQVPMPLFPSFAALIARTISFIPPAITTSAITTSAVLLPHSTRPHSFPYFPFLRYFPCSPGSTCFSYFPFVRYFLLLSPSVFPIDHALLNSAFFRPLATLLFPKVPVGRKFVVPLLLV